MLNKFTQFNRFRTVHKNFSTSFICLNAQRPPPLDNILPIRRANETHEQKIKRLIYKSRKRGILEMDIILSGFAAEYLNKLNKKDLEKYDLLLDELDWNVYRWITDEGLDVSKITNTPNGQEAVGTGGGVDVPEHWKNETIVKMLKEYVNRGKGLKVPEIYEY
ncbi:hypothetical protein FOG51_00222 [Hanseniaspora uvarum]|jgi:succinate dehydrogenase flavin-adding protein (antitoxin of CptAB toxin-antitoxin module)|uniref:Succinate dehydrogenase assembly factor 2, mitochondrial n=1 Tax=Hanseniaspora uvarum TaxID=29833 RepID=A0A1E5R0Y6_HANUV|nr:hypothetical protein FOG48_02302 [Hanseniaspora uvarum]KKA01734.1 Succinate dehydrogenase assembly factor 2, mitochondrial [Hanseniaspora uvarum DSM 2768]KAF0274779.1 hypothetical protein FOG51_00222 [Hanseniaspora uvarum]KAF0275363.1 hypothetical protein FOG50_03788 [Hanseniaspora uvarum]OEJ80569.1 Succinate dehydrogenase assembly factor 2, mitochondrial [Hanseniaspora uvarum]